MNEHASEDQGVMRSYLLGRLKNEDADRLDELSVTDGEFAEALSVVENDLVDEYANGELSGEDRRSFESYYLATPARRRRVTFAQGLQQFAESAGAATTREASGAGSRVARFLSFLTTAFPTPGLRLGAGVAVVTIVLLATLWYFLAVLPGSSADEVARENSNVPINLNSVSVNVVSKDAGVTTSNKKELPLSNSKPEYLPSENANRKSVPTESNRKNRRMSPGGETRAIVALILPPPRRSPELRVLSVPPGTDHAAITLEVDAEDYRTYRAVLRGQGPGPNIWSSNVKASRNAGRAAILLRIPAKLLTPQIYSITLSGLAADGSSEIIGDYNFRVVP